MIMNMNETETIKDIILKDFTYNRSAIYRWFLWFFGSDHYESVEEKNKQAALLREHVTSFSSAQDDFFEVLGNILSSLKVAYWKIYAKRIKGGERISATQINELNHGQYEEQLINCLRRLYNYLSEVEDHMKDSPHYSSYSDALRNCRQLHDQFLAGLTDSSKIILINNVERFEITAEGKPAIRYTDGSAVNLKYSSTVATTYQAANFTFIPENRAQPLNLFYGSGTFHQPSSSSNYSINGEDRDELGDEQIPLLSSQSAVTPSARPEATPSSKPTATNPSASPSGSALPRMGQRYQPI